MTPLAQTLAPWHEFYALLGSASATLVALLFVAASVGAGAFTVNRPAGLRMFLSASVVHFSSTLAISLIVLAPIPGFRLFGGLILLCGVFGLVYSGMAWHGTVRGGFSAKIDLEDRIWYAVLPAVAYLFATGAGVALIMRLAQGCTVLAVAAAGLLVAGIHNAWDITIWSLMRRRE